MGHTVLPATQYKWTRPDLTPASRPKLVLDLPISEATRQCTGRKSNSRPIDHKSDALTTTPPSHPAATSKILKRMSALG